MRQLSFSEGGFPLTNDRLESMQKAWQELKPLAGLFGNKIKFSYTTKVNGADHTEKYGIVDGEIFLIEQDSSTNTFQKKETTVKVTYDDGTEKNFEKVTVLVPATTGIDLTPISRTIQNIDNQYNSIMGTLSGHGERITALESSAGVDNSPQFLPKGGIIMWGGKINFYQETFGSKTAFCAATGIPYGYIPAGDIEQTMVKQSIIDAWNAYLSDMGVETQLSFSSGMKKIEFSKICGVNLSDKFITVAKNDSDVKAGQGTGYLTIGKNNLPSHSHSVDDYYWIDNTTKSLTELSGLTGVKVMNGKTVTGSGMDVANSNLKGAYYKHDTDTTGSGTAINLKEVLPTYGLYYLIKMI